MGKYLLGLAVLACICSYEVNSQLTCANRNNEEYVDADYEDVPNRFGGAGARPSAATPGKPGAKPVAKPGAQPVAKPGGQPAAKPGAKPPAANPPAGTVKPPAKPKAGQAGPAAVGVRSGGDDDDCTCVGYNLCSTEPVVHKSDGNCEEFHGGENIIDIRLQKKKCEHYLDVCCPNENIMGKDSTACPDPDSDSNGGFDPNSNPGSNPGTNTGNIDPGFGPDEGEHPPPSNRNGCGHRNPDGVDFCIIGDTHGEAEFGEFPWMVAIAALKNQVPLYQCGGSLINYNVVLTAAHCVAGMIARDLVVRAGEWDTQTTSEPYPYQDLSVNSIIMHEHYTPKTLYNDVALLILDKPAQDGLHIGTICLPEVGTVFDRSRCFTSGWGRDVYGQNGTYQVILKKRDLPIVPKTQCQADLRKTRLGQRFKLHESFICAGGEPGMDACTGDGGSPLVCPLLGDPTKYQQAGIVAWGIGCGENRTPGVYVDVAQFRPWIDRKIAAENYESSSYIAN